MYQFDDPKVGPKICCHPPTKSSFYFSFGKAIFIPFADFVILGFCQKPEQTRTVLTQKCPEDSATIPNDIFQILCLADAALYLGFLSQTSVQLLS